MDKYDAFVNYIHKIALLDCSDLDAVYEDRLKEMFGTYGLNALLINKRIESCGIINGRRLYAICKKIDIPEEVNEDVEQLKKENKKLREMIMKGF